MKVLILDQSPQARQEMKSHLDGWDWETIEAGTTQEALKLSDLHPPDIIVAGDLRILEKLREKDDLRRPPLLVHFLPDSPPQDPAPTFPGNADAALSEAVTAASLRFLESGSINEMAQILLDRCGAITGAPFGFLYDLEANGDARFLAISGLVPESLKGQKLYQAARTRVKKQLYFIVPKSESFLFAPVHEGRTVFANALAPHPLDVGDVGGKLPVESFLGVPLKIGNEIVGAIGLVNRPGGFSEREAKILETFAQTAALAIQSARTELARQLAMDYLSQAQKMEAIGQLAGGIAHDFNNLLTIINGYSDLLLRHVKEGDPIKGDLETILEAGQKAAGLTRQLLAFSRQQMLEPKVVNFNRLIEGLEKILRRLIREDIDIELSFAADLGWVKADPGQLEQILLNLMVNARDAMPTGGKITIETANAEFDRQFVRSHDGAVAGSYVMFAVKDSGAGMSKEVKARIFEPFFTTKERERGTGLGLATVYGIIKQTGGYILVDSRPGEGSTFRVYLPRTEDSPATFANSIPCSEIRGTGTLMVVEDQRDVLNLVEQTLRECGFSVLTAGNPEEALRRLDDEAETIDLLLTDIVMPGLSGPQLADRLKKSHPELKVLFMSGYGQFEGKNRFVAEKGTAFLAKPFSPRALVTKVHELLGIGVAEAESSTSAATP